MIASGVPQGPSLKTWLGGIEPAWRLLDPMSFAALRHPPSPTAGPIRFASDLTPSEIQQSAVARNTLALLHAAAASSGLKLTATGRRLIAVGISRRNSLRVLFTMPIPTPANAAG